MTDAYIYDAVRTPRGKGRKDGSLHEVTSVALAGTALSALRDRNDLDTSLVEDVIMGCVTAVGENGGDIGRNAVFAAGYAENVPGVQINRFCASGMEAVNMAANQVRGGAGQLYVAGGVEVMSRVPMGSDGAPSAVDPTLAFPQYFVPQGISADLIATKYGFSRDDCDAYAVESQRRAAVSLEEGRFKKSVVPVKDVNGLTILDTDEYPRAGTDMQALGALKPAFKEQGEVMPGFDAVALMRYPELEKINHVHHAGNSSGIVDGASAVLIGTKEIGEQLGLKPRARIRQTAKLGNEPCINLIGPVPTTEKILREGGFDISDFDLFEVNEAFASVVLRFMQAFDVDHDKVNINGGAIALGHPLGATGAMIIGTLLDEMERQDKGLGLATLCVASGMGAATVLERV
ncbi:MAG: acetyl-CoA C-acetyltransferase [Pseudomonadota bacterium]